MYPHSSVKTMSRQSVVLLLLLFTALLWPGSQHEKEPSGSAGPTCNISPSVHTEAEGKGRDIPYSLAKEHPWAEHLTCLPKKEVGALSSVFALYTMQDFGKMFSAKCFVNVCMNTYCTELHKTICQHSCEPLALFLDLHHRSIFGCLQYTKMEGEGL